jgi:hypothetical protein
LFELFPGLAQYSSKKRREKTANPGYHPNNKKKDLKFIGGVPPFPVFKIFEISKRF